MSDIKSEHIVSELLFNIDHRDLIKARIVIEHIESINEADQAKLLFMLNKSNSDFAIPLLAILTITKPAILVKFPSIREALYERILDGPDVLINQIRKKTPELRLYLKLISDFQIYDAIPAVVELLDNITDVKLLHLAITSLGEIGEPAAINAISEFLYSSEDSLIAAAIIALGNIGTPTAMQRLAERLGASEQMDIQIVEVFAQVQDSISMQKLNECLLSHSANLRNLAISKLIAIGKKAIPLLTDNLRFDDSDLLIHSLNVIGDIGDESAIRHIRKLIHTRPKDPNVRFVAYETLSKLPRQKGDYVLAGGMTDDDETVRIAAAKAINNSYSEVLSAGIRNMVSGDDNEAELVMHAVIDAQADNIVVDLLDLPVFADIFPVYVAKETHQEIRDFYIDLLVKYKKEPVADKIRVLSGKIKPARRKLVIAVDDSTMILKIYQKILNSLGFEPKLFNKPEQAVDFLLNMEGQPYLVCTDLNMPVMTGIELIRNVRHRFPKNELPILMVTTQNDIQDRNAAIEAGASEIIYKPFSEKTLSSAIELLFKRSNI